MFLLILDPKQITVISYNFTFQYVSINTHFSLTEKDSSSESFLSNMFLLILVRRKSLQQMLLLLYIQYVSINTEKANYYVSEKPRAFTFQYVSINTDLRITLFHLFALHSNMFLLIQIVQQSESGNSPFTFQYVSINTLVSVRPSPWSLQVYISPVSINTLVSVRPITSSN